MKDQNVRRRRSVRPSLNCRVYPTPSSSSYWRSNPTAGRSGGGSVAERGVWCRAESVYGFLEFGAFSQQGREASPAAADHSPSYSCSGS